MKNKTLIIGMAVLLVVGMSFLTSCNGGGEQAGTEVAATAKCGMDLVLAESLNADAEPEADATEATEPDSTSAEATETDSTSTDAEVEADAEVEEEEEGHEGHNH